MCECARTRDVQRVCGCVSIMCVSMCMCACVVWEISLELLVATVAIYYA